MHCKKGNKKYDELRKKKARKLARIKGERVIAKEPPKKNKSATTVAKKITDKYKRLREKKNINIVEEIKDIASNKGVQITAKKISNKYKKMRYKKPPPTFLVDEADVETIDYNNDSDNDIFAKESVVIATNEILNKYKNDLDEAETINYVDDTNLADVKENKNAKITAKKITEKYKKTGTQKNTRDSTSASNCQWI